MHSNNVIGNDIVDLFAEDREGPRDLQRFCGRVCTAFELDWLERHFAHDAKRRTRAIWSLWAAKEAAFKALYPRSNRREAVDEGLPLIPHFMPRRIEVEADAPLRAARIRGRHRLVVRFLQGPRWIHAVCQSEAASPALVWIARHDMRDSIETEAGCSDDASPTESEAVRNLVYDRLRERPGAPREAFLIHGGLATGRPPELECKRVGFANTYRIPISLSHHGEWLAASLPGEFAKRRALSRIESK